MGEIRRKAVDMVAAHEANMSCHLTHLTWRKLRHYLVEDNLVLEDRLTTL